MEGSLYKLKKGMTGTTWKKNWVEVDTAQIRQFPSKGKPSAKEVPKNAFPLSECHLEVSHLRKLCFKIMHKSSSESMVLAVDDDDEYNKWFETLRKNIKSATKAALRAEATRDRGNNGPTGGATADFDDDDIDEDEYGEDGEDVDDESASDANSDEGLTDAERYEKLKLATILSFFAEHNKSKVCIDGLILSVPLNLCFLVSFHVSQFFYPSTNSSLIINVCYCINFAHSYF